MYSTFRMSSFGRAWSLGAVGAGAALAVVSILDLFGTVLVNPFNLTGILIHGVCSTCSLVRSTV